MENRKIIHYKQIDSTNTELSRLALRGAEHGTVVIADEQTAGRGRRGREWESPAEDNIYMSMLLRPQIMPEKAPMITLVMAYAIAKVLKEYGFSNVQVKWPNDLIVSGQKVCGILTEMVLAECEVDYIIIGVGVNVNTQKFPDELKDKATSLYQVSGKFLKRQSLIQDIVECFEKEYQKFERFNDLSFLQEEYNEMLVNCGKEVRVLEPGNEYQAVALGINQMGELRVRLASGEEAEIFAGEVSVRGVYGYV